MKTQRYKLTTEMYGSFSKLNFTQY